MRGAINAANSMPDNDAINFNIPNCPDNVCTIQLSKQLAVARAGSLNIYNSTEADKLRVLGLISNESSVRILEIYGGANLTIDGATLANGSS